MKKSIITFAMVATLVTGISFAVTATPAEARIGPIDLDDLSVYDIAKWWVGRF